MTRRRCSPSGVADAADTWLSHVEDTEAFRRLVVARVEWKAYRAPMIDMESGEELLDALADASPPIPLGQGVADLEAALRRQARRSL
jgi:hypothetical protein